ncbi:NUDIX domain-containing protein [Streptomyces sp. NPDC058067]|uniref:NUDIX domain-containing protein n=1 Tax=Streptomyces sp. NPDC058067 TaxID=3346324 RepID=UPI0036ED0A17
MPNNPPAEGNPVAHHTDDRSRALKPALESMTLLVAAVIVHDMATNRGVLLQRSENAKFAQGMWDLPVGKSGPGEPITETAVRELYEETGLMVKPESLKVAHIIHGAWGVEAPNGFLTVVFAAHDWTGEPENREPHKHAQVQWVDTDAIPDEFVETTAGALHHYVGGGQQRKSSPRSPRSQTMPCTAFSTAARPG